MSRYAINEIPVGPQGIRVGDVHYPRGWFDGAVPADLDRLGAVLLPDPEPVPPTKAQRLADVRAQATALIQANLPQPWDVLRHLAAPEFIAWADDYLGLVAAELTRLETAIETDQEPTPDWPEVEP
jgi:hypothetical protein